MWLCIQTTRLWSVIGETPSIYISFTVSMHKKKGKKHNTRPETWVYGEASERRCTLLTSFHQIHGHLGTGAATPWIRSFLGHKINMHGCRAVGIEPTVGFRGIIFYVQLKYAYRHVPASCSKTQHSIIIRRKGIFAIHSHKIQCGFSRMWLCIYTTTTCWSI